MKGRCKTCKFWRAKTSWPPPEPFKSHRCTSSDGPPPPEGNILRFWFGKMPDHFGLCECEKFLNAHDYDLEFTFRGTATGRFEQADVLFHRDYELYASWFVTAEGFGCVHHEERGGARVSEDYYSEVQASLASAVTELEDVRAKLATVIAFLGQHANEYCNDSMEREIEILWRAAACVQETKVDLGNNATLLRWLLLNQIPPEEVA